MKISLLIIAVVLGAFALGWIATGNEFFLTKTFAPKFEAVRRTTFEQSKAYNEGVAQELRSAQLDYARAKSDTERQAIASYALHQTGGYDTSKLPPDLQSFVSTMSAEVSK